MARPKLDSRLQNIEQGIQDIKGKLCKMHPCESQDDVVASEEDTQ